MLGQEIEFMVRRLLVEEQQWYDCYIIAAYSETRKGNTHSFYGCGLELWIAAPAQSLVFSIQIFSIHTVLLGLKVPVPKIE
jgi:hypothetical protein